MDHELAFVQPPDIRLISSLYELNQLFLFLHL